MSTPLRVLRARRCLVPAALLLAVGACQDRRGAESSALPLSPRASFEESTEVREDPVDLTGSHGSHYSLATVAEALGHPVAGAPQVVGVADLCGHYQMALHSTVQGGFPTDGSQYMIISSGDSRGLGYSAKYSGCTRAEFVDVGGIDIQLAVPTNADALSLDYRFFTVDTGGKWDDYFRMLLIDGTTTREFAVSTINGELGAKSLGLKWGPVVRTATVDVTTLRGKTVTLRLEAGDRYDGSYTTGAVVDNLRFTPDPAPSNHAPVIASDFHEGLQGAEGLPMNFSAIASDEESHGLTFTWTFGDGQTGVGASINHVYADNGVYPVTLTVTDDLGLSSQVSFEATVGNIAPSASALNATVPVSEGESFTLTLASPSDPSPVDQASLEYAFDCGSGYGPYSSTNSATCPAPDNGVRTVRGRVRDKDGGVSPDLTASVTVANVAPVVGVVMGPIEPTPVNTGVSISTTFSDPGLLDSPNASIDWGDGTVTTGTTTFANGTGSVTATRAYPAAGVYRVRVTVVDKDRGTGWSEYEWVVVYDPDAGFVTGGGWIDVKAGSCTLTPQCKTSTGKAPFGFVSKYTGKNTVPTGSTEFQLLSAGLNFKSKTYEWLVVSGSKAQYRGTGTINGQGTYAFLLTVEDGGKTTTDKFRIKIWDPATGQVVFDNAMGASDDIRLASPQPIAEKGNIMVKGSK